MQALDTVDQPNKEIRIRTYFSEQVMLEVGDNGPGIDPALENSLFESFTSTKLHGENLGLGLAIVNTIVAAYAGTIQLTHSGAAGAVFTVALPPAPKDRRRWDEDIACR